LPRLKDDFGLNVTSKDKLMKATGALSFHGRFRSFKRVGTFLAVSGVFVLAIGVCAVLAADQFFAGDGSALTASKWGTVAAGPFTSAFTNGNVANFATANGTGTGGSITVGGINAAENFTLTSSSGTISNLSNGVVPISVSSGKTLDFAGQPFTSSSTAGYTKNGAGVLALAGGTYGGGFTLGAGTVIARGVNAMGGNAAPGALNINGGAIGTDATRSFAGKYSSITVGGDFQLGVLASVVSISSDTASMTFNSNTGLGAATRTITIGANGTYTLGGIISGNSGVGLTVARVSGATGKLILSGANTYSGNTTVNSGTLALGGSGSIVNSPAIEVAGGAAFDVSGLTTELTLASGQALKAGGTTSSGTIATTTGRGLTLSSNSPLQFTAFNGTAAPLTINGAGTVTLTSGNVVTVTVANGGTPLGAGDYTLISKGTNGGVVAGTAPASVTVNGNGIAGGTLASLEITGQQLVLHVVQQPGTLQLSSATYSAGEGGGSINLDVTRTGGSGGAVSVGYMTGGGTATPVSDYAAATGTLNWMAGDSANKTINIPVTDDSLYEGNETFNVTLSSPVGGATLGALSTATVTINDNDTAPSISINSVSVGEGGGSAVFTVTQSAASGLNTTFQYSTADGTATASSDYTAATNTTATITAGNTTATINVPVLQDAIYEGPETFNVTLGNPTDATIAAGQDTGTGTISDDESPPTLTVGDVTLTEPSSGVSYASFPVTLSGRSAQSITATYATADGTAVAPGDYTALSGTVSFAPGETSKTVAIAVKSDSVSEPAETFSLNLSNPVNAPIADGTGVATIMPPVAAGQVIISEFRLRGPGGQYDEFVEVYNNTDSDIVVTDANPVTCAVQTLTLGPTTPCGWSLLDLQGAASGNIPRFVIPAGTIIPARGHYLAAGTGYSLSALAAPDLTYDPPGYSGAEADFTGLALYNTADRDKMTPSNVFDAVGFDGMALPFREGTGLLPPDGVTADVQHSFARNQGSSRPTDTGDNCADFTLVATDPSQVTNGTAVLGMPGPENRTALVQRNSGFSVAVPPGVTSSVRRTSPAVTNGALGTLSLRRRFTNNTAQTISKLRFRVADVSTWNSRLIFGNQAEMRVLDATLVGLSGTGLLATTVETPPQHPDGGGVNTGMAVNGSLTLLQPLAPGQSLDVELLLGVMKGGSYQFVITVEAAP
jgi:autotransporter-associated beta strand protein